MQARAGSEQRPMNHAGVKLMQSSGAAHKEGQLGQFQDGEPERVVLVCLKTLHSGALTGRGNS